jgi:hypothetical protein
MPRITRKFAVEFEIEVTDNGEEDDFFDEYIREALIEKTMHVGDMIHGEFVRATEVRNQNPAKKRKLPFVRLNLKKIELVKS